MIFGYLGLCYCRKAYVGTREQRRGFVVSGDVGLWIGSGMGMSKEGSWDVLGQVERVWKWVVG
jgi:hypothetical protein